LGGGRLDEVAGEDRWELGGGAGVETSGADDILVRNGGVGEERVLGGEGLVNVGMLDSGGVEFERFNDHAAESSEMGRDGFRTEDVEDENARGRVDFIIERDKSGIFRVGIGGDIVY
jgi:hypothetical protein